MQRDRWERHAREVALHANINRDTKQRKKPYEPHDFNPYAERKARRPGLKVSMGALMSAMFDRDGSRMAKELSEYGQRTSHPSRAGEC